MSALQTILAAGATIEDIKLVYTDTKTSPLVPHTLMHALKGGSFDPFVLAPKDVRYSKTLNDDIKSTWTNAWRQ